MTTELMAVQDLDGETFLANCKQQYLDFTNEQRLTELKIVHRAGLENAMRMAALIWCAHERGDDMKPYRRVLGDQIMVYLSIARGELTLDSLRTWGHRTKCIDVLKKMPPPVQQQLCHERVAVYVPALDGTATQNMMALDEIVDDGLASQVFDHGTVRSVPEQEAWKKRQERKESLRPKRETFLNYEMDDRNETVDQIRRMPISFADIEALYKECKRRRWGRKA